MSRSSRSIDLVGVQTELMFLPPDVSIRHRDEYSVVACPSRQDFHGATSSSYGLRRRKVRSNAGKRLSMPSSRSLRALPIGDSFGRPLQTPPMMCRILRKRNTSWNATTYSRRRRSRTSNRLLGFSVADSRRNPIGRRRSSWNRTLDFLESTAPNIEASCTINSTHIVGWSSAATAVGLERFEMDFSPAHSDSFGGTD